MINYIQAGDILTLVAPATVVGGQLIQVGGHIGVCASDAASGDDVEVQTVGVFRLPKATGFVPTQGSVALFDFATDGRLESTGTAIGWYVAGALTGDTYARVKLDPAGAQAKVNADAIALL